MDDRHILLLGWGYAAFGWLSSALNAHLAGQKWWVDLAGALWSLAAVLMIAARARAERRGR